MDENIKNLINAIGSLAEMAGAMRDTLMANGFTREEAVKMAADFILGLAKTGE